jgi:hypothetical protein
MAKGAMPSAFSLQRKTKLQMSRPDSQAVENRRVIQFTA